MSFEDFIARTKCYVITNLLQPFNHSCNLSFSLSHLHPGFHHIDGCVPKHTGSSGNASNAECSQVADVFGVVPSLEILLQVRVHEETNGLVGPLLYNGRSKAFIGPSKAWRTRTHTHTETHAHRHTHGEKNELSFRKKFYLDSYSIPNLIWKL